jgi:putative ABC transport system permease protein
MDFHLRYVNMAVEGLMANKFRVFLSVLGLSLGISSVIIVMALSMGARESLKNFYHLKEDCYIIRPDLLIFPDAVLNYDTCKTIRNNCPDVLTVSPYKETKMLFNQRYGKKERVVGTADVRLFQDIEEGRFLTGEDVMLGNCVCVMVNSDIKWNVLMNYFWSCRDPVGRSVKIENVPVELVGILEQNPYGQGFGIDDVIMPVTTVIQITGDKTLNKIEVKMSVNSEEDSIKQLRDALKIDYGYKYNRFKIESAMAQLRDREEAVRFSSMILMAVALLTLFVSGTGIINILIVSVYERILEVGIRRAMGATKREILTQFLIESSIICFIGGITGILIAYPSVKGLIKVINKYGLYNISLSEQVDWHLIIPFSLIFSCLLGVIFGAYPAKYAADFDVVECLRHAEGDY